MGNNQVLQDFLPGSIVTTKKIYQSHISLLFVLHLFAMHSALVSGRGRPGHTRPFFAALVFCLLFLFLLFCLCYEAFEFIYREVWFYNCGKTSYACLIFYKMYKIIICFSIVKESHVQTWIMYVCGINNICDVYLECYWPSLIDTNKQGLSGAVLLYVLKYCKWW